MTETDPSFARAEALLAKSARRWVATSARRPSAFRWWGPSAAGFREYRTDPETATVYVYGFASAGDAASAEPDVRAALLDGTRAALVRDGELLFWIEAPMALPGRPLPREIDEAFDAALTALQSP